jgi:hypothetical protein
MRKTIHLLIVSTLLATIIFTSMPAQAALATGGGQPAPAIPAVPTLISPKGTIGDTHPPYKWSAVSGASAYRLAVYCVGSASYVILKNITASYACSGGVCTYHPFTVLVQGDYRWKVLAKNASGVSAYSAWMYFDVGIPDAPTLVYPINLVRTLRPVYQWNASPGATAYRLAVYDMGDENSGEFYVIVMNISSSFCTGSVCTYCPDIKLRELMHFRWKVLAKNALGASAYSDWMFFETDVLHIYDE